MAKHRIHGRAYTIYPKKQKSGVMYYAEFRGTDGEFGSAKSTGCRTKGAAETWAMEYLNSGQVVTRENLTFSTYAEDFFDPEGVYAKNKKARGKSFSERRLSEQEAKLNNHLIPAFGKYRLTDLDYKKIEKFQLDLLKSGRAGDTVNAISAVLGEILEEAFKEKLLHAMPIIERVGVNAVQRGVLSAEEAAELFKLSWTGFDRPVLNETSLDVRTANLLAAATGLRMGEIAALKRSSIQEGFVDVKYSWDAIYHKLKSPKTVKSTRFVPIPKKVREALVEVMEKAVWKGDDDFVFQGDKQDRPLNPELFRDALYQMFGKIGIDEAERTRRQLTFHSWRHWFNSLMVNGKIPTFKVQSLTGHTTDSMTANYYHADEYRDVLELQENTFK